jgi:glycosyltransferase involved in cell wall biosynthesis
VSETGVWLARLRATDRRVLALNAERGFDRPPADGHLRVVVDVRIPSGVSGGVEQAITGLAAALSRLDDGDEEYLFLLHRGESEWILPHLGGRCRPLYARQRWFFQPRPPYLRESDGVIEAAGAGVMHFTWQWGFRTRVPSLYQPWDLQHRHLPGLFSPAEVARREAIYPALCAAATRVVVPSAWTADDLRAQYGVPAAKIARVPVPSQLATLAVPTEAEIASVRARYGLPGEFALFPAQAWPHKNHERLLRALAALRERDGIAIPLVCTGAGPRQAAALRGLATGLGLESQVTWPGFIPAGDLRCLYRAARLLVFPSLFEGWGFPVLEAMEEGVVVACSDRTSLPELAGDAALLFDPENEAAIAGALLRAWRDEPLRAALRARGRERAGCFSWERTARTYRALYRRTAGRALTGQDETLLAATRV